MGLGWFADHQRRYGDADAVGWGGGPGDTVTVSYDKPTPDNNNRLEDASGNEVASFSDQAVDNTTADTTAPVF